MLLYRPSLIGRMGRWLLWVVLVIACTSVVFASFEYGFERVSESARYSEYESSTGSSGYSGNRHQGGAQSNYARSRSFSYDRDYEREFGFTQGYGMYDVFGQRYDYRGEGAGYGGYARYDRIYRDARLHSCSSGYFKYRPFGC